MSSPPAPPRGWRALAAAMRSWRTASVALQSFASGLPLGLVLFAIPDWLRSIGVDIRVIGIITLAQAPWSFKVLWAPLMDRWAPAGMGRRRGWIALAQVALFALTLALAGVGAHPDSPWVVGALALAIAVASATQDIAIDAYAVDVLRKEEQGVAVGARTALYRAAMLVAGTFAIWLAGTWGWPTVLTGLAVLYLPLLVVTRLSPEPEVAVVAPRTLREAVWLPFLGMFSRHRALEILAFVVFYKLADNLASALVSPFLVDMGYDPVDRGFWRGNISTASIVAGTFVGGALTDVLGLGRSLWIFGLLQIVSNVGYVFVAGSPPNRPLLFGAVGFEAFTTGLGTGAFFVFLLRLTQKRFSATQYALFSSLFGIPRIVAGPVCGFLVDALGWSTFFWLTIASGIPGMVFLARFVPWGVRDPDIAVEAPPPRPQLSPWGYVWRAASGGIGGGAIAALSLATLEALKVARSGDRFDLATPLVRLIAPSTGPEWIATLGMIAFCAFGAIFAAAIAAARRG